jgi:DNA-binding MarR family transcriptional regulator
MDTQDRRASEHEQTLRSFLIATHLLLDRLDRDLQRQAEIPLAYYQVLACLSEASQCTLRMSDLAAHLHGSRSRLSHAVARLEERGWVQRVACPTDKRGAYAVLTAQGRAAFQAAAPGLFESVRQHLFDQLSAEQAGHLRTISELLAAHLCRHEELDPAD